MTVPMFSSGGLPEFPKGETPVPRFRRGTSTQDCCCDNDTSNCICCAGMEGCESVPPTTCTVTFAGFGANGDENFEYHKCDSGCDAINGTYIMGEDEKKQASCEWGMYLPVGDAATSYGENARILCSLSEYKKNRMHVDWRGHDDCYPNKPLNSSSSSMGWDYDSTAMYATSLYMRMASLGSESDSNNPNAREWKQGVKAGGALAYEHADAASYSNAIRATPYVWHNSKLWTANTENWTRDATGALWRPYYIGPEAFDEDHWNEVPQDKWLLADGVYLTAKLVPDYINEGTHKLCGELWLGGQIFEFAAYVDQEPAEGERCPLPIEATMTMDMQDPEKPGWFFEFTGWPWYETPSWLAQHHRQFASLCNWSNHGDFSCATNETEETAAISAGNIFRNPQRQNISVTLKFHTPEE